MHRKQTARPARLLTLARDLKRRKARERNSQFVAEGVRVVEELVRSGGPVTGVLVARAAADTPRVAALLHGSTTPHVVVSDADFASAASTAAPQGVLAIADVPDVALASIPDARLRRVLVLDAIQDPGNVGTLIRTAAGLRADAVVALPGTVDPWNAKVVRGGAGAHFHVTVTAATTDELASRLRAARVVVWGADAAGRPVGTAAPPERLALAVGNEGAGLTPPVRDLAAGLVSLPMAAGVESLNVAVAAGILMYELFA
ncbi:MAG: RNA methyltransferase [Gemmatimonadota bacterium]|nr:RNA methyltransferase [Gemmatimonadota bacterium]